MSKLSGKPPSIIEYNLLLYGCMDPDMEFLNDQSYRNMLQNYLDALPKALPAPKGTVFITGTAGELDNVADFQEVFFKPPEAGRYVAGVDPYGDVVPVHYVPSWEVTPKLNQWGDFQEEQE